jgi:hypothetical protein
MGYHTPAMCSEGGEQKAREKNIIYMDKIGSN